VTNPTKDRPHPPFELPVPQLVDPLNEGQVLYALRCIDAYGHRAPIHHWVVDSLSEHRLVKAGSLTVGGQNMMASLGGPFPSGG